MALNLSLPSLNDSVPSINASLPTSWLMHSSDAQMTCKNATIFTDDKNITFRTNNTVCLADARSTSLNFTCNLQCFKPTDLHKYAGGGGRANSFWTGRPEPLEKWGFGLLFSFLVSICAVFGAFLLPMMQKPYFDRVLNGLIGLAVGCLSGSAIFHLIPESFFDTELSIAQELVLLNKGFVIMGGIYLFFLSERAMKIYADYRKRLKAAHRRRTESATSSGDMEKHNNDEHANDDNNNNPHEGSYYSQAPIIVHTHDDEGIASSVHQCHNDRRDSVIEAEISHHKKSDLFVPNGTAAEAGKAGTAAESTSSIHLHPLNQHRPTRTSIRRYADEQPCKTHEHDHGIEREDVKKRPIRTVAWMVIAGDGLHNFIDGLGMGAAFSMSILNGISVSIAVLCEELPHELGDLAILINSGMSLKQALFYNFMSAVVCILGLCCGLILGDVEGKYIFAVAAGAFLYISLVDMFPEMTHTTEAASKKSLKDGLIMLLVQNVGLVLGACVMYLMARYGKHLENYVKNQ